MVETKPRRCRSRYIADPRAARSTRPGAGAPSTGSRLTGAAPGDRVQRPRRPSLATRRGWHSAGRTSGSGPRLGERGGGGQPGYGELVVRRHRRWLAALGPPSIGAVKPELLVVELSDERGDDCLPSRNTVRAHPDLWSLLEVMRDVEVPTPFAGGARLERRCTARRLGAAVDSSSQNRADGGARAIETIGAPDQLRRGIVTSRSKPRRCAPRLASRGTKRRPASFGRRSRRR
jgi:hypothetical protein